MALVDPSMAVPARSSNGNFALDRKRLEAPDLRLIIVSDGQAIVRPW